MDTKLKNNHNKITVCIILAAILIPAIILVALNPYFSKKAEQYSLTDGENVEFADQEGIVQSSYVLYAQEIMENSDTELSIADVFYPSEDKTSISRFTNDVYTSAKEYAQEGSESTQSSGSKSDAAGAASVDMDQQYTDMYGVDYEQFENTLNSRYEYWEHNFYKLRDFIGYQVYDEDGKLLSSNTKDKTDLRKLMRSNSNNYAFGAVMSYNRNGKLTISDVYGDDTASSEEMLRSISRTKPLSTHMNVESDLFQAPRSRTYVYSMTNDQYREYIKDVVNYGQNLYPVLGIATTVSYMLALLCAVAALALVFIRPISTRNYKIFHSPCAFALTGGILSLVMFWPEGILFTSYNALEALKYSLNLDATAAAALVYTVEMLAWIALFALLFWSVSCLGAFFILGPRRYWRERTLTYRIYAFIKRCIKRIYYAISNFDLSSNINRTILKLIGINFLILLVICSFWFYGVVGLIIYSFILFFILRKYADDMRNKYQVLLNATNAIADGNLDVAIREDLGIFNPLKGEITKIQSGFKKAVQNEVKSQRMKTDLITNVSHDLKTPLTAIITYVNLLKDETDEETRRSYINVLEQKSLRLKALIEDLFEISKATSNNVTMNFMTVDIVGLLKQVALELSDKIESSSIDFRWRLPEEKVLLSLDSQKTYRIFENLLVNITKYSMPGTRAFVTLTSDESRVYVTMKNVSASELTVNPQELTDRFVRGDSSRNTEGSGLGLAIAKSFVDLQAGSLTVDIDADLFTVTISFPRPQGTSGTDGPTPSDGPDPTEQQGRQETTGFYNQGYAGTYAGQPPFGTEAPGMEDPGAYANQPSPGPYTNGTAADSPPWPPHLESEMYPQTPFEAGPPTNPANTNTGNPYGNPPRKERNNRFFPGRRNGG